MTDAERSALRDELINVGFIRNQYFTYSDGTKGNNKLELDFDTLSRHPEILGRVVLGLGEAIEPFNPGCVIGLPNGATEIAAAVSEKFKIPQVRFGKNPDKTFYVASVTDMFVLERVENVVLIDDVYRRGTNFKRAQDLMETLGLGDKIVGAAAIFDRGQASKRTDVELNFPVNSVVSMHIREKLSRHSLLGRNPN